MLNAVLFPHSYSISVLLSGQLSWTGPQALHSHSSWPHLVKSCCFPSALRRAIPEANSWPQQCR